jgi:hypothetical protein
MNYPPYIDESNQVEFMLSRDKFIDQRRLKYEDYYVIKYLDVLYGDGNKGPTRLCVDLLTPLLLTANVCIIAPALYVTDLFRGQRLSKRNGEKFDENPQYQNDDLMEMRHRHLFKNYLEEELIAYVLHPRNIDKFEDLGFFE